MNYDEIWAYSYERIRAYLLERGAEEHSARPVSAAADDTTPTVDGTFTLSGCTVVLNGLAPRRAGQLSFDQTRVRIDGPGADSFHHEFKLNFLSGGA